MIKVKLLLNKILTAALLLSALCASLALPLSALPAAPSDSYILDDAEVINGSTEDDINRRDEAMYALSGAQVAVVTVEKSGYSDLEQYALGIFKSWGIGSSERNNGVLFVIETGTNKYWITPGAGLNKILTAEVVTRMLEGGIESAIDSGDYNSAVQQFFNGTYDVIEKYYGLDFDSWDSQTYYYGGNSVQSEHGVPAEGYGSSIGALASAIGTILLVVLVLVIVVFAISMRATSYRRYGYGGYYYRPWFFFGGPIYRNRGPRPPFGGPGNMGRPGRGPGSFGGGRPGSSGGFGGFGGGHSGHSGGFSGFGGGGSRGGGFGRH